VGYFENTGLSSEWLQKITPQLRWWPIQLIQRLNPLYRWLLIDKRRSHGTRWLLWLYQYKFIVIVVLLLMVSIARIFDHVVIISFEVFVVFLISFRIFGWKDHMWVPLTHIYILNLWMYRNGFISGSILIIINSLRALYVLICFSIFLILSWMHDRTSFIWKWVFQRLIIIKRGRALVHHQYIISGLIYWIGITL